MDGGLQRILDLFNNRLLVNMAPERRARKLAILNTLAPNRGNAKTDMEIEKSTLLNRLRGMLLEQSGDKLAFRGRKECEKNIKRCQGHRVTSRTESHKAFSEVESEGVQTRKEEVKRCSSVPADVESPQRNGSQVGEQGLGDLSQNYLTMPNISVTNLLEEIEADLPSSYSLANVLDHTFHTVTNVRTWARLSRVGTNCVYANREEIIMDNTNSDNKNSDHTDKIKYLQRETFIQKTLIEQADKAMNLCKVRKRNFDVEDLECFRILLTAKLRYEAINLELQKLTFSSSWEPEEKKSGELKISDVCFTVTNSGIYENNHFICIARHKEKLFASLVQSEITNGKLHFPVNFTFNELQENFILHLELYKLSCVVKSRKELKKTLDLKNLMKMAYHKTKEKNEARSEDGHFECAGSGSLRIADIRRREKGEISIPFNVGSYSNIGKTVSLNLKTRLVLNLKISGFLDLFKGLCWHRLWCCPVVYTLQFWCYPEDMDNGKTPVESVVLLHCRENVQPVSMDVCIRPYSFMITYKESEKGILLSASSHKDMMNWISYLRFAIHSFEAWAPNF